MGNNGKWGLGNDGKWELVNGGKLENGKWWEMVIGKLKMGNDGK